MPERPKNVSRMAPAEIHRLIFGVRYEPQLKLQDTGGSILDEILRADGTPFGPTVFPFSEAMPFQFRLLNSETSSDLVINSQDTILQMSPKTRDANVVNEMGEAFHEYVLGPLKEIGGVKNIVRYGLLIHFKPDEAGVLKTSPIAHYLASEVPNANTLFMRFSRRLAAEEALAMKHIDDYRNAIYAVQQSESGEVQFSIDYQHYFQPSLDKCGWERKPFSAFVDRGTEYVEREFLKWFQNFSAASEVA